VKLRDDNFELGKTFADLNICADASGLVDEIWMWFDLKDENWVTVPFHDINCGEVDRLPGLVKRILRVHQKPILEFEDVPQQCVIGPIPFRLYSGIGIDSIELSEY